MTRSSSGSGDGDRLPSPVLAPASYGPPAASTASQQHGHTAPLNSDAALASDEMTEFGAPPGIDDAHHLLHTDLKDARSVPASNQQPSNSIMQASDQGQAGENIEFLAHLECTPKRTNPQHLQDTPPRLAA